MYFVHPGKHTPPLFLSSPQSSLNSLELFWFPAKFRVPAIAFLLQAFSSRFQQSHLFVLFVPNGPSRWLAFTCSTRRCFTKKGTSRPKHQQNQGTQDTSSEVLPSPCQFPSEPFRSPYPKRQLTLSAIGPLLASGATIVKISIDGQTRTARTRGGLLSSLPLPICESPGAFLRVITIRGFPSS